MLLEVALAEFRVVEGVEVRCLSAEHPDESELRDDDIADEAKPRAPHEFERTLRLSFHLTEWLPRGEKVGDQVHAGKGGKGEVTGVPCCLEGASQEDAAGRQMLRPMGDVEREDRIDATAEAVEPTLLDQIYGKPTEANTSLGVT